MTGAFEGVAANRFFLLKGMVISNPALAPIGPLTIEGSMGMPGIPSKMMKSRSAWNRDTMAHSNLCSERMSMSSSVT